jgi:hypothetical protein
MTDPLSRALVGIGGCVSGGLKNRTRLPSWRIGGLPVGGQVLPWGGDGRSLPLWPPLNCSASETGPACPAQASDAMLIVVLWRSDGASRSFATDDVPLPFASNETSKKRGTSPRGDGESRRPRVCLRGEAASCLWRCQTCTARNAFAFSHYIRSTGDNDGIQVHKYIMRKLHQRSRYQTWQGDLGSADTIGVPLRNSNR